MKDVIKQIINRLFPELAQGYHLPIMAVVVSIADAPGTGGVCDVFRPRQAVNIRLLDEHGNIDDKQPIIESVPVAMPAAGQERGFSALPEPGSIVELAFAYGKQSQPFIRSVMPFRMSLPEIEAGSMRWQQSGAAYQEIDASGNMRRVTNGTLTDDSLKHSITCMELIRDVINESSTVAGDSTEDITGVKRTEAGAIKLLASGSAHMGAVDNLNYTAGQDLNAAVGQSANVDVAQNITIKAGQDLSTSVGGNETRAVTGSQSLTVGQNQTITITGNQTITVNKDLTHTYKGAVNIQTEKDTDNISKGYQNIQGNKIWIGSQTENLLALVLEFMTSTISALNTLASHTHPNVSTITQGSQVSAASSAIAAVQSRLAGIKK